VIIIFLIVINFGFFYYSYLTVFPYYLAENWSYGFKEIAQYVQENESKYERIIIDPQYGVEEDDLIGVPSLFVLYFGHYSPENYLAERIDREGLLKFGKYEIRQIKWTEEGTAKENLPKTLFVVSSFNRPIVRQEVLKLKTITMPDGTAAFEIFESSAEAEFSP